MVNNQQKIDDLLMKQEETEEYLAHMGMQRDELVENYMNLASLNQHVLADLDISQRRTTDDR